MRTTGFFFFTVRDRGHRRRYIMLYYTIPIRRITVLRRNNKIYYDIMRVYKYYNNIFYANTTVRTMV